MTIADQFRNAVCHWSAADGLPDSLLIERSGDFSTYYAPFELLNTRARIAIVGITPGMQQASNALASAKSLLLTGRPTEEVLATAKLSASFSGPMRNSLVACLDAVGLQHLLGIRSAAELFSSASSIAHFTSVLRYPVLYRGENYTGTPAVQSKPWLRAQVARWFESELSSVPDAVWVPLGVAATRVLEDCMKRSLVAPERVLVGIPHPSPSNIETQQWFLGKRAEGTPGRRDGLAILAQRRSVEKKISQLTNACLVLPEIAEVAPPPSPCRMSGSSGSFTGEHAKQVLDSRLRARRLPNHYIAAYETKNRRQLALERQPKTPMLWLEYIPEGLDLIIVNPKRPGQPYGRDQTRHSNLEQHAPNLFTGEQAYKVQIPDQETLLELLHRY